MYKAEFDNHLQNNFSFKAVFLYGQSNFFVDYYKDLIISKNQKDFNTKTIYFEEYSFEVCSDFLNQPSLFGGDNILVIKTQNIIPKKELDSLIHTAITTTSAHLVIQYYELHGSLQNYQKDKKSIDAFVKCFSKLEHVCYVRFFKPTLKEALDILTSRARDMKIDMSLVEIRFLYESFHNDLGFAYKELDKLALLDKKITNEYIKSISSNLSFDDLEDIFIRILEKKDFLSDMQRLIEHTTKDMEFIRSFCDFISNLILFNIFIKDNGFFDSKAIIGVKLPRHIEEKKAKLSIKFKLNKYIEIIELMQELELSIKTNTHINPKMSLYSTFARLEKKL